MYLHSAFKTIIIYSPGFVLAPLLQYL